MNAGICGKVIRGQGKGKKLGFPTANIELGEKIESGIYTGLVAIGEKKYKAGIFVGNDARLLEVHLIGFSGNLYGKKIAIEIGEKIRDVMKFGNDEELKKQIRKDIAFIMSNVKAQRSKVQVKSKKF